MTFREFRLRGRGYLCGPPDNEEEVVVGVTEVDKANFDNEVLGSELPTQVTTGKQGIP
jgi:hypothetical protein